MIESVDVSPAPLRIGLGSQTQEGTLAAVRKRIAGFEAQRDDPAGIMRRPVQYGRILSGSPIWVTRAKS